MLESSEARLAAAIFAILALICASAVFLIASAPRLGGRGDPLGGAAPHLAATGAASKKAD